uniref:Archaelysin family metallopeptidase 1 n=1 Tax=Petromyzon marinus TaxID=7757 RepID=S4RKM9_PETMA
ERLSRGERALLAGCHRGGAEGPFRTAAPPAWLLCQWPEEPQGFRDFAMGCPPRCRALHGTPRPTLHLQPLGFTDTGCERSRAFVAAVRGYAEAFLPGFTVRLNEPLDVAESRSPCRRDARTGHWQIHADGLLHYLKGLRAPGRSCLLGLTLADLYAGNSADFVFEKCLPAEGVAVCSLARLDPDFDKRLREARLDPARSGDRAWFAGLSLPATPGGDFLLHSCKAVVHVACHLLGMAHCRWLACVMQGVRSAAMARARPPHLCPVCLHKLHHAAAFRLAPRYR